MIALPLFSQRDEKWKSKKLGTSLLTLGTSGCLVTCLADICSYYGKDANPSTINDGLIRVNGFANQNLYIWGSITKIYPDISEPKRVQTPNPVTSTQFASIDAELIAGRPVIIEVDFVPATASIDMHFVVLIGKDQNGNYVIADPWYGDTATLQRYGDPAKTIQQYIFTFGAIPPQATTQPTDEQGKALTVITEAFKTLPDDDLYKPGNLEGFVRGIVGEHKNYKNYEIKSNQFDALIEKWFMEWHLKEDPNKSHFVQVEEEAGKLLSFEDSSTTFRNAIESLVGPFTDDSALLKALGAEKDDKQGLVDQVKKLSDIIDSLKKKKNIKYTINILGYIINVLEKE